MSSRWGLVDFDEDSPLASLNAFPYDHGVDFLRVCGWPSELLPVRRIVMGGAGAAAGGAEGLSFFVRRALRAAGEPVPLESLHYSLPPSLRLADFDPMLFEHNLRLEVDGILFGEGASGSTVVRLAAEGGAGGPKDVSFTAGRIRDFGNDSWVCFGCTRTNFGVAVCSKCHCERPTQHVTLKSQGFSETRLAISHEGLASIADIEGWLRAYGAFHEAPFNVSDRLCFVEFKEKDAATRAMARFPEGANSATTRGAGEQGRPLGKQGKALLVMRAKAKKEKK
jgi:hypothetical protein